MRKSACCLALVLGGAASLMWMPEAQAGPPFFTDDPVPPEYRTWEVNYAISAMHAADNDTAALPSADINYGAREDIQLHLQTQLSCTATDAARACGPGDIEAGLKYRLTQATGDTRDWALGIYPAWTIPVANAHRQLGNGASRFNLPLWAQTTRGAWIIFGGGGCTLNHAQGQKNTWFTGWAALNQINPRLQLGGELSARTADSASSEASYGFNLGGTYELRANRSLLFSAGRGISRSTSANLASIYIGLKAIY